MAYFNLPFSVRIAGDVPVDGDRYLTPDLSGRDGLIGSGREFDGLQVFVEDIKKLYILLDKTIPLWQEVGSGSGGSTSSPTSLDKDLTPLVTSVDGDSTGIILSANPIGYIEVMINGIQVVLGDGVKTKGCYFSNDGGTTAIAFANIVATDTLYWNGSIAGYELDASDRVDLNYNIVNTVSNNAKPTGYDKDLTPLVTIADGDTTGITITNTPVGYVQVMVRGAQQVLGDGVKTKGCYFSNDGGTTARLFVDIVAGDTLYWNGSISGYELNSSDKFDLNYYSLN